MKYVLYALVAVAVIFAVLLLIAIIRAIKIKAKPVNKKGVAPYTKEDEKKYAKFLSEMIKVPTVSVKQGEDLTQFRKFHAVLEKCFPLIHEKLEKVDLDGNLLFRWKGKDSSKDGILLMGHQDVVPAAETDWKRNPFSGDIVDGRVHGRGAMDCKCTLMAELAAVEELLEEGFVPERDVYIASSINEEISGGGADMTVNYLKEKGVRLAVVMDEGGAIVSGILPGTNCWTAAAGIVEKGTANIKFTAKGKGGHSSTPPKNTPIARLAKFVCDVEKNHPFEIGFTKPVELMFKHLAPYTTFPLRLLLGNLWLFKPLVAWAMPKFSPMAAAFLTTTCVFTMCEGSKAPNVIPQQASVIANIRPSIQQSRDECVEILRKIAEKYDIETELILGTSASDVVDSDSKELKYVGECVQDVFPGYCFTPYYVCGGTDCRNYQVISDNCIRFTPIRMDPQQLAAMHAANENISTDAIADGVKFYKYFIKHHD